MRAPRAISKCSAGAQQATCNGKSDKGLSDIHSPPVRAGQANALLPMSLSSGNSTTEHFFTWFVLAMAENYYCAQ
jgi:hypothetical protein